MRIYPTAAERLLIDRRRQEWDQCDAAEYYGVSLYRYRAMEGGQDAPNVKLDFQLEPFETCYLLRRRGKMTLAALAEAMDLSVWWICQMERGDQPAEALVEHWDSQVA